MTSARVRHPSLLSCLVVRRRSPGSGAKRLRKLPERMAKAKIAIANGSQENMGRSWPIEPDHVGRVTKKCSNGRLTMGAKIKFAVCNV